MANMARFEVVKLYKQVLHDSADLSPCEQAAIDEAMESADCDDGAEWDCQGEPEDIASGLQRFGQELIDLAESVRISVRDLDCSSCHGNGTACSCGDRYHVPCQSSHFVTPCGNCQRAEATA